MKTFLNDDFLLSTDTAKTLYHQFAADMPIIDYHCHINPLEILCDHEFESITEAWLGGDHYKWRLMRAAGIDERFITGDAPDREKFRAYACALSRAIGNPLYHWTHLELKRFFGYNGILTPNTADEVFDLCNQQLHNGLTVRKMIQMFNVEVIGTTDDPTDSLEYHTALAHDPSFHTKVVPSFRPDKAIAIDKPDFNAYIAKLSAVCDLVVDNIDALHKALLQRIDLFHNLGCRSADHGIYAVTCAPASPQVVDGIFLRALAGEKLNALEQDQYRTALLLFLAKEYHKRGWVMQIHFSALRSLNHAMLDKIGPDTGFDAIGSTDSAAALGAFCSTLNDTDQLPKMIVYSLNPNDNLMIESVIGCFSTAEAKMKMQHGSAWWYNDTKAGMIDQLTSLASSMVLGNFVGMLTDSRSFLSYTRHEYFRRILCNLIGDWVENGEYPADMETLGALVSDISYHNAKEFFGF